MSAPTSSGTPCPGSSPARTRQTEDFGLADYGLGRQPRVSTPATSPAELVAAASAFAIVPARELADPGGDRPGDRAASTTAPT